MAGATVKSVLTLTALTAALTTAIVLGSAGAAPPKATVALVDPSPLTIAGHGFGRGERVIVKVAGAGASYRKVVFATRTGRITARWADAAVSECSPYVVTATGARGAQAVRRIQIPPPCGIVLQP